ncbi:MAG: alpha-amylase, partial [Myxococcaceae bacterium]
MTGWRRGAWMALLLWSQAAFAGTATVYYYTPYKAWSTAYLHNDAAGTWTTVPGASMSAACTGWVTATVTTGTAGTFQAVFTDGQNRWDNAATSTGNYSLPTSGTHQVKNGQVLANAGNPCTSTGTNSAEVFYYTRTRGWSAVNLHYAPTGGTWTTPPGVAMNETACTDWVKKTVSLGAATGMKADFNNGGTWDNNNGADYTLGTGRIT